MKLLQLLIVWGLLLAAATQQTLAQDDVRRKGRLGRPSQTDQPVRPRSTEPRKQAAPPADATPQPTYQGGIITGRILDADDSEALIGATVVLRQLEEAESDQSRTRGAYTDLDGNFRLTNVRAGKIDVKVSYVGYISREYQLTVGAGQGIDLGTIKLEKNAVGIEEVKVIASASRGNLTPVATTRITEARIAEKYTTSEDFPAVAKFSPSVYVSRVGGGFGDSRVAIRGFEQENMAILINGIPINDMEFGKLYWVNWMGLTDVTREVQIQRGMGVSRLAINSVGGTMNIITRTTDIEPGGAVSYETSVYTPDKSARIGSYQNRASVMVSSGRTEDGWAISFQGSRISGPGYIDKLDIDFWSYFLSISKEIGSKHLLVFTAMGAPQEHGERLVGSPLTTYERYGNRYNPNWGYLDGQVIRGHNFYHKPQFALNHYWSVSDRTQINTSAYYSLGTGGGNFTPFGPRTRDQGLYDYELMRSINLQQADTSFTTSFGENVTGRNAQFYSIDFRLDQYWVGAISSATHKLSDEVTLTGGLDLRHYEGDQFFALQHLFGGDFLLDRSDRNAPVRALRTGDKLWQHKRAYISWAGAFGQAEYNTEFFSAFASASASNTRLQRRDYFLYTNEDDKLSDPQSIPAGSIKGGVTLRPSRVLSFYGNIGYFTRAPFFGNIFRFNNEAAENIVNEKIFSTEIGVTYQSPKFAFKPNVYFTRFSDKTINLERGFDANGNEISALISGLAAQHYGFELEAAWNATSFLSFNAFASIGDWRYVSDVSATIADFTRTNFTEVNIYSKDLRIGNSPQTSLGLSGTLRRGQDFFFSVDVFHYAQLYANLDVTQRSNPDNRAQPWRLPDFTLVDAYVGYNFAIGKQLATFKLQCQNLFDKQYLNEAQDGINSDRATALVFYGFGRILSASLTLRWGGQAGQVSQRNTSAF